MSQGGVFVSDTAEEKTKKSELPPLEPCGPDGEILSEAEAPLAQCFAGVEKLAWDAGRYRELLPPSTPEEHPILRVWIA